MMEEDMIPMQLSKSLAVAAAIVAPLCLTGAATSFAAKPAGVPPCHVGSLPYETIQKAVADASCLVINVPAGLFVGSLDIRRDVEIRGAGPTKTIVHGSEGPAISITSPTDRYGTPIDTYVVTLKGMTITGGKPFTTPPPNSPCTGNGGGIDISQSVVTVQDAVITGNEKRTLYCPQPSRPGHGGGINSFRSTLVLKNSIVRDNVADRCGGIRSGTNNMAYPASVTTIMDSVIDDNFSDGVGFVNQVEVGTGGGICVQNQSVVTLRDSSVSGNVANSKGGAILNDALGTLILRDTIVTGNSAGTQGGGIYNNGAALTLRDSFVTGNHAGIAGGGIYDQSGTLVTKDSTISGNTPNDIAP
jgi:hypothetical protein